MTLGTGVVQVPLQCRPFVVAAAAVDERGEAHPVTPVKTEFEIVPSLDPAHVVCELIDSLDRGLRSVRIGTDVEIQVVHDCDVRKLVQTWKGEVGHGDVVVITVEPQPDLVIQIGPETVELRAVRRNSVGPAF
jgi:hypothetical protein